MDNQISLFKPINKGADISECGRYRFTLWRIWDENKPLAMIIGLNPSTADATSDDKTIIRCIGFMKRNGFGGFYMLNLFAFRATEPADMKKEREPVGFLNDQWLRTIGRRVDKVIFAWGADGGHRGRNLDVIAMFPDAYCFGLTKDGHPKHPLFLASDTQILPLITPKGSPKYKAGDKVICRENGRRAVIEESFFSVIYEEWEYGLLWNGKKPSKLLYAEKSLDQVELTIDDYKNKSLCGD